MTYHILLVDDDVAIRSLVSCYFEKQGYRVSTSNDGVGMYAILETEQVDLILLDINLPGAQDGFMLTRDLRSRSDIGIILISGRTDCIDRIVGLEMGADDYYTKPLELRELLARVKNLLWRVSLSSNSFENKEESANENKEIIQIDDWAFDINRRVLSKDSELVKLTKAEYEMLIAFTANKNRVMSRDRLLNLISHRVDAPNDRMVDVLVRRLRNKIEKEPRKPQIFITVHGEGYMFTAN